MARFREKLFRRERFLKGIRQRFFVRFHMSLILVGTALSGLLASKALLEAGIGSMAVRYPLAALLAAVAGAAAVLLWQAPSLLPEAAFDAALAASLLRGARRVEAPEWTEGVLRGTWKPFLWVLAVTLAFALVAGHYFPHARKIADLFTAAQ